MSIFHDEIIRKVRDYSFNMEHNGALSPEILEFIYAAKLFKLFVPIKFDGLQAELPAALRIFEQAAEVDGSFGWLITIGSGGGFFSATLPPETAAKLYSDPKAVVAGSGHPSGKAKPVPGGYTVSGQWKYCSGSSYATIFTANCMVEQGEEAVMRSFAFMPEQVQIIRDWKAFGLKATESHSIAVDAVFVPEEHTFSIASEPHLQDPIYRYPFLQFAQTSFAAVCIGIWRHFVQEARDMAEQLRTKWDASNPQRYAAFLDKLEGEDRILKQAVQQFYETVDASWLDFVQHDELSEQAGQEVSRDSQSIARAALNCAHKLFPLLGMTALMEDRPLNRIWRDLHTVTQHAVLVPADSI
jgi:alkylation response protein AidB-like acyl-CoA dehydrogenase